MRVLPLACSLACLDSNSNNEINFYYDRLPFRIKTAHVWVPCTALEMLLVGISIVLSSLFSVIRGEDIDWAAVEKFIPNQDPIQPSSYFRIGSYNAKYFDAVGNSLQSLQYLAIDLTQIKVFTLILQEFPKTFYKSAYYSQFTQTLKVFGLPYICECFLDGNAYDYGTIFASRNPLTGCTAIPLAADEVGGHTAVLYKNRNIDLVAAHLENEVSASAERISEMNLLVEYIKSKQLDDGYLMIGIDTTDQYNSDAIWALRSGLPIEDSFFMLDWTRPSYASYQGITRNYFFMPRAIKTMPVGSYVLESMSNSFAALMDIWKYPDEVKAVEPGARPDPMAGLRTGNNVSVQQPAATPARADPLAGLIGSGTSAPQRDPMEGLRKPDPDQGNVNQLLNDLNVAHLIPARPGSPFMDMFRKMIGQGGGTLARKQLPRKQQ